LYDKYLQKRVMNTNVNLLKRTQQQTAGSQMIDMEETDGESDLDSERLSAFKEDLHEVYAKSCQSILVCTGVYCSSRDYVTYGRARSSNHNHRDFVLDPVLTQPKFVTQNVHEAVKLVFQKEKIVSPFIS
jgi:hypothetical protein